MKNPAASLDDLRAQYPHLGFAVYALTPGGVVTFEIHTPDSKVFSFEGPTLNAAVLVAFPPEEIAALPPPAAPPEPINVFD